MDAMGNGYSDFEGFPFLPHKSVEEIRDRKTLILGMVTIVCQALSERRGSGGFHQKPSGLNFSHFFRRIVSVFCWYKFLKWSSLNPQKRGEYFAGTEACVAESCGLGVDIDLDPKASKH